MTKRYRLQKPDLVIVLVGMILATSSLGAIAEDGARLEAPGPLSSAHAELGDGGCDACHGPGNVVMAENCLVCHDRIAERISAGRGVHREVGADGDDCVMCHVEHGGRDNDVRAFATDNFDHKGETGFSLDDDHAGAAVDCSNCHTTRSFLNLEPDCAGCHSQVHAGGFLAGRHASLTCQDCHPVAGGDAVLDPAQLCGSCHEDAHRTTLGTDCAFCHSPLADFRNASRDFHKETLLPLEGRHLAVPCAECHWNGQLAGTPTRCYDCHWIRRQDDRFQTALGVECETCHRPTSWTAVTWDHGAATGQPLGAAHLGVACQACHASGRFEGSIPFNCVDCHLSDYQSTNDPNHQTSGFPTDCEICHSPSSPSWEGASFAHSTYPLVGSHAALDCSACHSSGIYNGLPSECVNCHLTDFQSTDDPNHQAAGFPTGCEICHSPSSPSWEGASFAHSTYPLVGPHAALDCSACHSSGVYNGLPSECIDCHLSDYQSTDDPNHQAAGFPTDCEICHSPSSPSWEGASFAHSTFPLVGSHTALDCSACHSSGVYSGLPSECVDCHLSDYQSTDDPNHQAAGFPTNCEICHSPSRPTWEGASVGHSTYPLVGSHAALDCSACHASGVYNGLPSECVDCHLSDYQSTDDPNHQAAGFPTDCEICHSPSSPSFDGASFAHGIYPLVGSHVALDCSSCHSSGVYNGLPSECVDCHLSDYHSTDDPDHQAAGFPTDCEICHNPSSPSFDGASFAHSTYALVGSHAALDCSACHSSGVYNGLPSECVDCHLSDYQSADDPNHQAAGFPNDCEICHRPSDASWNQGVFDHVWFPIDSGKHRGFRCSQCHTSAGSYAVFSCTTSCHPSSDISEDHEGRPGYLYNSAACYSCHPDGQKPEGDR